MPNAANLRRCLWIGLLWPLLVHAQPFTPSEVYTAYWPPYVNKAAEEPGLASRVVQLVYYQMGLEPDWQQLDYYFSYGLLRNGRIPASFPYFRTNDRQQEVLFSEPLMAVENGVFYSSRQQTSVPKEQELTMLRVGRVAGYSYGEKLAFLLPEARVYNTEVMALTALAEGEIDLLPISVKVARQLIQAYFPHRVHEFKLLPEYRSMDEVHLIAPKNPEGEVFIRRFNQALLELKQQGLIDQVLNTPKPGQGSGYVRLVPTEGFPVVTGYSEQVSGSKQFYVIPQGSRATVLAWDKVVLQPHATEKIFDGMMHYSKVRIVDGPHAGRDLYVRNMHLEVE